MNKDLKTVCDCVTESLRLIEDTIKTSTLDIPELSKLLHKIRMDAQNMENGLRLRKMLMVEAGIEEKYQERKKTFGGPRAGAINTIRNNDTESYDGPIPFEVTIKQDQKIVYQEKSFAGAVSIVESVDDIDDEGSIVGVTQRFTYGHPMATWFAFDQLSKALEDKKMLILAFINEHFVNGRFRNSQTKQKVLAALRNFSNQNGKSK